MTDHPEVIPGPMGRRPAPFTVNTMPEGTLKALPDHGDITTLLHADGSNCEEVLARVADVGVDVYAPCCSASGGSCQVVRQIMERIDDSD
jgi:hypothetical protein